MKRAEFMQTLSEKLSVLPDEERLSALSYYEEYFNDAEDEERAAIELGTPEYVAKTILDDFKELAATASSEQKKYNPFDDAPPVYETVQEPLPYSNYYDRNQSYSSGNGSGNSSGINKILLVILIILASPFIIGIGVPVITGIFIVFFSIIMVLVCLLIAGVACIAAGIFAVFYALFRYPFIFVGMFVVGEGLAAIGIGVFLSMLGCWSLAKVVPSLVRGFVKVCRWPFGRRKKEVAG